MDYTKELSSNNGETRHRALEELAKKSEEVLPILDKIFEMAKEPLKSCKDLGSLSDGQPDFIGQIIGQTKLLKAIENLITNLGNSGEDGLDAICTVAGNLNTQQIRMIYSIQPELIVDWLSKNLRSKDSDRKKLALTLIDAVATEYSGRLATKKTYNFAKTDKPVKKPEIFEALEEKELPLLLQILESEEEWLLRAIVARILGSVSERPEVIEGLSKAVSDKEQSVRRDAIHSLERFSERPQKREGN